MCRAPHLRDDRVMGHPRSQLIDGASPGVYHCVTRCVRRAFLCGDDGATGRNFDHRKQWLEDRLLALADLFAVSLLAYAVMSNHVHVVIAVDPHTAAAWDDRAVAERWVRLFPVTNHEGVDEAGCRRRVDALCGNADRLAVLRERLGNLSWFMRCLAEPLARLANREDGCTGRFWEGRFKCQALLDDAAVLACMAYVDLNPVHAGIASDLPSSEHTSIRRRLRQRTATQGARRLQAVAGSKADLSPRVSLDQYIDLVDWTGRHLHPDKRGMIAAGAPPALRRIAAEGDWLRQVRGIESRYWRAVGSLQSLRDKAAAIGQQWLKMRTVAFVA
jgi:hypothetical protein